MQAARRAARRGVRGPARARTATAARSRRSAPTRPPGRCSRDPAEIDTPEQLRDLLGEDFTFSAQQFAAITAPLEPAVVIAGAGSGKTTVMAARVVWLVATGQVAPGEILGLTFTTKATAELADPDPRQPAPGRAAARPREPRRLGERRGGGRGADGRDLPLLRLGAAHRARPADRPRARHPADRRRQPLPARRPRRAALHRARSSTSPTRPRHVVAVPPRARRAR